MNYKIYWNRRIKDGVCSTAGKKVNKNEKKHPASVYNSIGQSRIAMPKMFKDAKKKKGKENLKPLSIST